MPHYKRHIFVCINRREASSSKGCCAAQGAEEVFHAFKSQIKERGLKADVRATKTGCLDQCSQGVVCVVYPEQFWYGGVKIEDVEEIIESHLVHGTPVKRLELCH